MEENNEKNELNKEEVINNNQEVDTNTNSCSNSNKKVIYIILGIAAFLLVCLIVFCTYYNSLTNKTSSNSSNNTTYTEDTNTNVDDEDNTSNDNQSSSSQSESTNQSNTKTYSKTKDIDISEFDFASMVEDIYNSFSSGNNPYILKCTMINQETLETSEEITQISQESFYTIVEKLKSAKSFDLITSSFFGCPPRNIYYVISLNENLSNKKFSIGYALNNNDFLVGYGNYGYAFHFENESDIDNFVESLK